MRKKINRSKKLSGLIRFLFLNTKTSLQSLIQSTKNLYPPQQEYLNLEPNWKHHYELFSHLIHNTFQTQSFCTKFALLCKKRLTY
jgi:hypothetical protein